MYNTLKGLIDQYIIENTSGEITGEILNDVLNQMVSVLGSGSKFKGSIQPNSEAPSGTEGENDYFYIATSVGTYTNFGNITVSAGEIAFVKKEDSSWVKYSWDISSLLSGKQDTISDLATIRSGASSGATAYQKPQSGIPKTDLSSDVQASLNKADTAIQEHQDISGKADKSETYTKSEVDAKVVSVMRYKGSVNNYAALEAIQNPSVGDVYNVLDTGHNYAYDGTSWDVLSGIVSVDGKADKVSSATSGNFAGLDANGNLIDSGSKASDFATASQGAKAGTAYQKPQAGIPESDLSSDVQQALQKHFKGWWLDLATLKAAHTATEGDSAYVKDVSPATTWSIYIYDATATTDNNWADSGTDADTTYVQTFADGQEVNEVHIINDLTTGGTEDVASAETVKILDEHKIDKVEIISEETTYTEIEVEDGYPKTLTGLNSEGNETSSSLLSLYKYQVESGKSYKIRVAQAGSDRPLCYFYDSSGTAISGSATLSTNTSYNEIEVTAPSTAAFIKLTNYPSGNAFCKLITIIREIKDNQQFIDSVGDAANLATTNKETLVSAINEVNEKLNEITKTESPEYVNLFDKDDMLNGYINIASGDIGSSSSQYKMSDLIPVIGGYYYYLTGRSSSKSIRCLDSDNTPIQVLAAATGEAISGIAGGDWQLPNVEGTAGVVDGQFKVPSNAVYVQFTVIFSNGDTADNLMLLEVGDSYDANYQLPSEYVPYGEESKTVVKEEALPASLTDRLNAMQEEIDNIPVSKKLKVLLVGSSHGVNTISMFPVLCKAAGIDIVCGNLYSGSATIGLPPATIPNSQIPCMAKNNLSFERFAVYENGSWSTKTTKTLKYALETYEWDVVIVQRGNTEVEKWDDTMDGFFQYLLDYIKDNAIKGLDENNQPIYYTPRIYFNSGLANGSSYGALTQVNTTNNIISTSEVMKSRWGIDIIPTAVALQYARKTILHNVGAWVPPYDPPGDMPDLTYDGQHIDTGIGQYVLACCVFEKIIKDFFNMGVRELKYLPVYSDISGNTTNATEAYFTPISEYYSRIGKTCAALACDDAEYKADTATWLNGKFGSQPTQYTITYNLTHCTSNNTVETIYDDDVYMGNLTVESGYTLSSSNVQVIMNNEDVTSDVFVTNNTLFGIRIGKVTGNIVITATAN